jgi:signal peptidase II
MPDAAAGWHRWLWLSAAVIVLDQATKHMILSAFRPGEERVLLPVLSLILAFNAGAAFSFLAGAAGWQRWLFAAVALAACALMLWLLRRGGSRWLCGGLALIIGGALGNLWDRLTIGTVVDFVLVHYGGWSFPAFNVADSAITVGAAALILDGFRQRHAPAPKTAER